jgi:hypothetical protein
MIVVFIDNSVVCRRPGPPPGKGRTRRFAASQVTAADLRRSSTGE